MKYYDLTKEEQALLDEVEKGNLVSVPNLQEEKKRLQSIAKNTLNKTKNINIRLSVRDIQKLKARAIETGLAYQTLAAAILRQYAARKIEGKL